MYSQEVKRDYKTKLICKDIWDRFDIFALKVWLVISENLKDEKKGMCWDRMGLAQLIWNIVVAIFLMGL